MLLVTNNRLEDDLPFRVQVLVERAVSRAKPDDHEKAPRLSAVLAADPSLQKWCEAVDDQAGP